MRFSDLYPDFNIWPCMEIVSLVDIKYFDDIKNLLRTMTQHSADDTYDLEAGSL